MFKKDDFRVAGETGESGGPESSDPRVHICVRAGAPRQVRAGRGGVEHRQLEREGQDSRRWSERRWSVEQWRRQDRRWGEWQWGWRGHRWGWKRGDDGWGHRGYDYLYRWRSFRDRPVFAWQVLTRRGVFECVGGGVVEAVVL